MSIAQYIRNLRVESETRYSCNYCEYTTMQKGCLKTHKETIHEYIGYSCNQCEYKTNKKGRLKSHEETVHEDTSYSCNQCEFNSKEKEHLKSHIYPIHKNANKQVDESQISTQALITDSRARRRLGTSKIKCDHCEWTTVSESLSIDT